MKLNKGWNVVARQPATNGVNKFFSVVLNEKER